MSQVENTPQVRGLKSKIIRWITLGLLLVAGSVWLWHEVLEDRLIPKRWGIIEEGALYRSGRLSASLVKRTLAKHGIETIIDLTGESPNNQDQQAEKQAATELGIELLRFPLLGNGTGDIENYAQAIAAMVRCRAGQKPALVHCAAGAQRTGGVTACYRMLVERQSPALAYEELKRYGWDPEDDRDLILYVNEHMAALASRLRELGILSEIPDPLPQLPLNP